MHDTLNFLARHGYWVLFGTVLAEQLGAPIPAVPVLVAMGALAGAGKFSVWTCLALTVCACLLSDGTWYWMGRSRGQSVLKLLCRISLEPDTCVSLAKDWFRKMGSAALLVAKFIPGFSTAAPPMAGVNGMPFGRFVALDAAGSAIWAGLSLGLGFVFRNQLEALMEWLNRLGSALGFVLVGSLAAYVAVKWFQRFRFVRNLRFTRIKPAELMERMKKGDVLAVLDLRSAAEVKEVGSRIPGAMWFQVSDMESRHGDVPRDREIILYCS